MTANFISFFKDEPDIEYSHRSFTVQPDGTFITADDRGYCPGSCCCKECSLRRAMIRRTNNLSESKI